MNERLLGRLAEELNALARPPVRAWRRDGDSLLQAIVQHAEATGDLKHVLTFLRDAEERIGNPATATDGERVATLVMRESRDDLDPAELVEIAHRALAPGGQALIGLPLAVAARLRPESLDRPDFRMRQAHTLGQETWWVFRRPPARPRVALFPDGPGACLQIRTLGPLEELESRGQIELCLLPKDADGSFLADKDLLILQRFGGMAAARYWLDARHHGVPVALELDDDFFNLPWYNPGAKAYGQFEVRLTLSALLRGSDAVVTSTPYLRQRMLEYNERVLSLHNLVESQLFVRRPSPFAEPGVTTFGYIGTKTHEEDFRPLLEPLRRLILESDGRVRAVFIGHVPEELRRLPGVRYLGWYPTYQNAANALSRSGANVTLAPLTDVEFNRSKSAMKYLEYGACGIPGIFSDVEAYSGFIRDGENGLLVREHTPEAWEAAMRRMVDRPAERQAMAEVAYRDVTSHHAVDGELDRFFDLYRQVIDRPAGSRTAVPAVVDERPAPLSLVVETAGEVGEALTRLSGLANEIDERSQVLVVSADRRMAELAEASGRVESIRVDTEETDGALNGVAEACRRATGEWVLVIDGRAIVPGDLLEVLGQHTGPNVGAVGPRNTDPESGQSTLSIERTAAAATLAEGLKAFAAGEPVTRRGWLDPRCVLLNRRAVEAVGGVDPSMIWEDSLVDLCLRLNRSGLAVQVANGTYVEMKRQLPSPVPPSWRTTSRERLGLLLKKQGESVESERGTGPIRCFGVEGERLDVWVLARPASPYLRGCLERIRRWSEVPLRLHVLTPAGDTGTARTARAFDAEAIDYDPVASADVALTHALGRQDASHAALLHDGVMVLPGWLRGMLDVALRDEAPVVAPFSNDGSPEQRMIIDRALPLDDLDALMSIRLSRRGDRRRAIDRCGAFCVLLDLRAVRRREGADSRTLDRWTGRLPGASGGVTHATHAYVHVLDHGPVAAAAGMGGWPGGPLDLQLPDLETLDPTRSTGGGGELERVRQLRPLLEALRHHPGNARVLARVGLIHLGNGDLQQGMSLLERARKLDPHGPDIRLAREKARNMLDSAAVSSQAAPACRP